MRVSLMLCDYRRLGCDVTQSVKTSFFSGFHLVRAFSKFASVASEHWGSQPVDKGQDHSMAVEDSALPSWED